MPEHGASVKQAATDLAPGRETGEQLVDGIHPGDEGHAAMAAAIGPVVAAAVG